MGAPTRREVLAAAGGVALTGLVGGAAGASVAPAGSQLYAKITSPSASDLAWVAAHCAEYIDQPAHLEKYASQLGGVTLTVYENSMFSTPSDPAGMPESWYLHSASGQRITPKAHPANTLMDPLSTEAWNGWAGWTAYLVAESRRDLAASGAQRVFLDMCGPAPISASYNTDSLVPVDPRTGAPFTVTSYCTMTGVQAGRVQKACGVPVCGNAYQTAAKYFKGSSWAAAQSAAGQAELWFRGAWQPNVQMVLDDHARGVSSYCWAGKYLSLSVSQAAHLASYSFASFLLVAAPVDRYTWQFDPATGPAVIASDLGAPAAAAPLALSDVAVGKGCYAREYEAGWVVVNPTTSAATVRVGGRSVSVAAKSGIVGF